MTKQDILKLRCKAQRFVDTHADACRMFPGLFPDKGDPIFADMAELAKGFLELVPDPYAERPEGK